MRGLLPTSWRPRVAALLPADPGRYDGPALAWWFAAAYLGVGTVRSVVHLLAPDGGASSIATIDLSVAGAANVVAMFGQWGAIQLLLALLLWVLLLRYRGLVPLVMMVFLVEPGLRELAGSLKPIETLGTAPGAVLNWVVVPVVGALLWLSLCPAGDVHAGSPRPRAIGGPR